MPCYEWSLVKNCSLPRLTKNAYHSISYTEKKAYHTISFTEKNAYHTISYYFINQKNTMKLRYCEYYVIANNPNLLF